MPPNFVIIMTDTQPRWMVGAYGSRAVDTPNLDRLAQSGIRFNRAYTAAPLCTPARGAFFSGLHPQVNGAWANNIAPQASVPLLGEIFRHYGYRAGYTGKWHLDGSSYFGDGVPGGGFESDWWYDGKCYARDIGAEMFAQYRKVNTPSDLRASGFDVDHIWGHRVADRAVDFLYRVGSDPFVLTVSFDEPHGPYVCPPEYWEKFDPDDLPWPEPASASADVPNLQHQAREELAHLDPAVERARKARHLGCNSYIDREIGRVIDAVEALHGDDTVIIYTTDHGDMGGSHGLTEKGPMMYEEVSNVPFLIRLPGGPSGVHVDGLVSHVDVLPTMLELAGIDLPARLHGRSLVPILRGLERPVNESVLVSFTRFAINHDSWGGFYPIRCLVTDEHKLAINLLDHDELYELSSDPREEHNRIDDPRLADVRDHLHDRLLDEMDRIRDPFRGSDWGQRAWRSTRPVAYHGAPSRPVPPGFPFEPMSV